MPYHIIALGDLVADLVFAIQSLPVEHERHQHASSVTLEPGGMGNFLLAGKRLGMEMHALGVLGDDAFGAELFEILRAEGVDVAGIVRLPGSTTTPVLVLVDQQRQHVFIGGKQRGEVIKINTAWQKQIEQASALFVSGFTLLEPQMSPIVIEALQIAQQHNVPIFFDPGPFVAEIPWELKRAVLDRANVLLLTEEEVSLLGVGGKKERDLLHEFVQRSITVACIKRGARGCSLVSKERKVDHPGFAVEVRDTTGAGDTFAAAFIYGWVQKWPLERIAAIANAMGAAMAQKVGSGRNVPTRQEIIAVFGEELG